MSPLAMSAQVVVDLDVGAEALPILADELRLRQAVWNLLANAIKFSKAGTVIEIRLRRDGDDALLEITDHGAGIDPGLLERVFERYWQPEDRQTSRDAGLGLGLAITRHLIGAHWGTVTASNAGLGHGATFTIRLPLDHAGRPALH
jgi:signal transduction histidine kinase